MYKTILLGALLSLPVSIYSQGLTENKLQEIINSYKSNIETATVIKDCGHVLDGSLFIAKQFENRLLDASLNFSSKERKIVAQNIHKDMLRSNKAIENHPAKNNVLTIINKITSQLASKNITYKLTIFDSDQINAFTTMGGYIYLTTGLLNFVDSYDELAFILGHEIAHEFKLHTQRKVTKLLFSSSIFNLIKLTDFQKMATSINSTLSAPFDQIDEYEADKHGAILAKKAGYDPNRFGDFFKKLEKYEKRDILTKLKSTHPFAKDRKNCITNYTN